MFPFALFSCAKAGEEFLHTDNTISNIWIMPSDNTTKLIYGNINNETGEILFEISRENRLYFNSKSLKVKATVGYDAFITPSLLGIKDLSSDFPIQVEAIQTGEVRNYVLKVIYLQ